MNALVSTPLNDLETSLTVLLTALTTNPTFSTAAAATTSLLTADDALTSALITLRTHQANHARLTTLRAEAERLETRVRDIVGALRDLQGEAIAIIGEDSEDEEDEDVAEKHKVQEVDYQTLLSFARRIGRYNKSAADKAAATAEQLRRKADTSTTSNGAVNGAPAATTHGREGEGVGVTNLEPQMLDWLTQASRVAQAASTMPYPVQEKIRAGLLGQLQGIAEADGEGAVEKEVERLIAVAEGRSDPTALREGGGVEEEGGPASKAGPDYARQQVQPPSGASRPGVRQEQGVQEKRKAMLDLDLYDPDEDDD